jgi:glutamate synthase (NADPH/NADH) small chain
MPLGIEGEELEGVWEALDFIFQTHTRPLTECTVGSDVVVIGAGNTAIDVATAARRLGANRVTIAYRRSEELVPAFAYEYEMARGEGIGFEWFAQPVRVWGDGGVVKEVEFVRTTLAEHGSRSGEVRPVAASNFRLRADMVVKALGQEALLDLLTALPELTHTRGRIAVDAATGVTSVPRLYAGGDCLRGGGEVVDAVRDGKTAAHGIHAALGVA